MSKHSPLFGPATALLLAGFLLLPACRKTEIRGRVIDPYGNPIRGVIISIQDRRDQAKSLVNGEYTLRCYPGELKLIASKNGFVSVAVNVNAKEPAIYRTDDIILYRIPPQEGLYMINSPEYIQLGITEIVIKREGFGPDREKRYCVPPDAHPEVFRERELMLFDYNAGPIKLFRLDEEGCAYTIKGGNRKEFIHIKDRVTNLEKRRVVREVTLEPGDYLYAYWGKNWFERYGYYLRIAPEGKAGVEGAGDAEKGEALRTSP